ncbi:MAG: hypothetical protein H6658_00990 [Ardenticatenaceae bacterium]|nr:hypothetical protein [Ardenticatenaceae bacterium]
MSETLAPFIWVVIALPLLLVLQRWIQTHLGGVALLLMGRSDRAVILYAILMFPGVLLHELSHWLMAKLLGVRTGSMSLLPQVQPDGTVQLGYVTYYKGHDLGPIRESLVGGAPLLAGTAVILLIGFRAFGVTDLAAAVQTGSVDALAAAITDLLETNDFLVWLYLLFAVANAMLPSRSDRRAWPAFLLIMGILTVVVYLLGLQQVVAEGLAGPAATVFGYLGIAFSMAIGVDLFFMLLIFVIESAISRIRGVTVVYGTTSHQPSTEKVIR